MNKIQFSRFLGLLVMLLAVAFMSIALIGCPTNNIKTFDEMSAKEKATFMMSMYNKQYSNYQTQAAKPELTEAEREILRKKKKILSEVYPLIELYMSYVDSGAVPSTETEQKIINYLDQLAVLVVD
jgi:hypothetical protein